MNTELKLEAQDFELDFELDSTLMEATGDLETFSIIRTAVTKVTCKSTCTCNCTLYCTVFC